MINLSKISDVDKKALIGPCPACVYIHSVTGDPAINFGGCHTCGDREFVLLFIGPRLATCKFAGSQRFSCDVHTCRTVNPDPAECRLGACF